MAHLPYRIAVVSNLLVLNRDWKIRDLTSLEPKEMRVLINIGSYMPIKSADIAYQSRIDTYTVSRAVKKLLALNLIESHQDDVKKNVKNLSLNDERKAVYHKLTNAIDERAQQLESVLSQEEQAVFFEMLERIETKTEEFLANQAVEFIQSGLNAPTDQKELIRWHKKTTKQK